MKVQDNINPHVLGSRFKYAAEIFSAIDFLKQIEILKVLYIYELRSVDTN
jgi:hypothetical protein